MVQGSRPEATSSILGRCLALLLLAGRSDGWVLGCVGAWAHGWSGLRVIGCLGGWVVGWSGAWVLFVAQCLDGGWMADGWMVACLCGRVLGCVVAGCLVRQVVGLSGGREAPKDRSTCSPNHPTIPPKQPSSQASHLLPIRVLLLLKLTSSSFTPPSPILIRSPLSRFGMHGVCLSCGSFEYRHTSWTPHREPDMFQALARDVGTGTYLLSFQVFWHI